MNDILNLTVKKEVFESICNGTSDEIYINRSKWWDKRMIEESGEPKDFRIVSISSGDSGKFDFPIWTIDIQKKHILVKIARVKEEKVEEVENTPTPKVELTQEMFNELWKSAIRNDEETVDDEDVDENEQSVNDYKAGKDKALKYLMGQIMKETKGQANPEVVNRMLIDKLQILNKD